jgi:hypothetical protein
MMPIQRTAISALVAAGLATLSLSPAKAQAYPPCDPLPLAWPFCIAGAAVVTAAAIATAPFRAVAGAPYYYYGQPYYAPTPRYARAQYQPWNRPSPSDHVARQLNRQELYGH